MKRLDVSQLVELCREIGADEDQALTRTLLSTLEDMSIAAAEKLGVAACGVEYAEYGVLASFAPLTEGDPCPPVLEAMDDEGEWQTPARRTLLICDDNQDQTRLASRAVSNLGVTVIETHSADEAWQAYQRNRVNLVFADAVLPDEDGLDLMNKIVALEGARGNRRKVPVITISGDAGTGMNVDVAERPGATTSESKPIDWDRLGPLIGELCQAL